MNETLRVIKTRRSIRSFTEQTISKENLEQIVEAGRYAPSAMNRQLCRFTVLQNQEKIARLAHAIAEELGRDSGYNFYKPNALIMVSNEKENPHGVEDCACAMENIFLAAHALGIGSVWINQCKGICDAPKLRAVLRELHLPDSHIVLGMAALGYAAQEVAQPEKANLVEWIL